MHEECKDSAFHLCNKSINDETNTKVASDLADADNYSHNEKEISTARFKMPNAKIIFFIGSAKTVGSTQRQ
jgi:hypothetical protein